MAARCSVEDCRDSAASNSMCIKHYTRWRRYGDPSVNQRPELSMTPLSRWWQFVEKTNTCWHWTGYINTGGYGTFQMDGQKRKAHRVGYEMLIGPIPDGRDLDHLCRVRHCVNPDHLEPVTQRENVLRGDGLAAQQSARTHCPKGHPYDEANTRHANGRRFCRQCGRDRYQKKGAPPLKTHCPQGHPYDDANTYVHGNQRICRTCARERSREWHRAQRERERATRERLGIRP